MLTASVTRYLSVLPSPDGGISPSPKDSDFCPLMIMGGHTNAISQVVAEQNVLLATGLKEAVFSRIEWQKFFGVIGRSKKMTS